MTGLVSIPQATASLQAVGGDASKSRTGQNSTSSTFDDLLAEIGTGTVAVSAPNEVTVITTKDAAGASNVASSATAKPASKWVENKTANVVDLGHVDPGVVAVGALLLATATQPATAVTQGGTGLTRAENATVGSESSPLYAAATISTKTPASTGIVYNPPATDVGTTETQNVPAPATPKPATGVAPSGTAPTRADLKNATVGLEPSPLCAAATPTKTPASTGIVHNPPAADVGATGALNVPAPAIAKPASTRVEDKTTAGDLGRVDPGVVAVGALLLASATQPVTAVTQAGTGPTRAQNATVGAEPSPLYAATTVPKTPSSSGIASNPPTTDVGATGAPNVPAPATAKPVSKRVENKTANGDLSHVDPGVVAVSALLLASATQAATAVTQAGTGPTRADLKNATTVGSEPSPLYSAAVAPKIPGSTGIVHNPPAADVGPIKIAQITLETHLERTSQPARTQTEAQESIATKSDTADIKAVSAPIITTPSQKLTSTIRLGSADVTVASAGLKNEATKSPTRDVKADTLSTSAIAAPSQKTSSTEIPHTKVATSEAPSSMVFDSRTPAQNVALEIKKTLGPAAATASASIDPQIPTTTKPPRTMTLQMTTATLGGVKVIMHLVGTKLELKLSVSEKETLGLLERDRNVLAKAVTDHGYDLHSLTISGQSSIAPTASSAQTNAGRSQDHPASGSDSFAKDSQPNADTPNRRNQRNPEGAWSHERENASVAGGDLFM